MLFESLNGIKISLCHSQDILISGLGCRTHWKELHSAGPAAMRVFPAGILRSRKRVLAGAPKDVAQDAGRERPRPCAGGLARPTYTSSLNGTWVLGGFYLN